MTMKIINNQKIQHRSQRPIQLTRQFRESVIGGSKYTSVDLDYYPTITKDIYKLNSVLISIPYKEEGSRPETPYNEKGASPLLFDPYEVFNMISNKNNSNSSSFENLTNIKNDDENDYNKLKSPLTQGFTISDDDDNKNEDDYNKLKSPLTQGFTISEEDDDDSSSLGYHKHYKMSSSDTTFSNTSDGYNNTSRINSFKINNHIFEEANTLLSIIEENEDCSEENDASMYDEMLTKLEISMEYEITQIHNFYVNEKKPIINELERRCIGGNFDH
ncbi:hypothetical protein BCR32DRAFT_278258 [Anaeromyces robustus]|uniref:Uncharacterized protein n=1 Tax=Anaeromyces robustus TaxID=1754192 RepID=A0A1Y1XBT0_9FUNG|nr:hypothetical protein BCR32DRAFT_278258 [Anaeromyces robustus]|eukprot:ORX83173.1 hypothetical protein BCR32DRAFT_278258 [Anaeromyces robustus]